MTRLSILRTAALMLAAAALPQTAISATQVFYGETVHVSTQNIKVRNPKTGQVLSFVIMPKFDQVFSADGKTTYTMAKVKPGQYVGVVYDTAALGIRHADKFYIMNNANQRIGAAP
jgi:hypothetical protein